MFKIKQKVLQSIIINIVLLISIFTFLLLMNNHNTMIITMQSEVSPLRAKLFYATEGEKFNSTHSSKPYKLHNNQYYFKIPNISNINFLRLDPSYTEANISIESIKIVRNRWFKVRIYDIPLKHILVNQEIDNLQYVSKDNTSFHVIGKNSQLNIQFFYHEISVASTYHYNLIFITFLLFMIVKYFYSLYKNSEHNTALMSKIILYSLFFAFTYFKVVYYKDHVNFGYPPDEAAHVKYINYVKKHSDFVPDFTTMNHYLSHPPLYYNFIKIAYDQHASNSDNIRNYRSLSILIYLFAFLLILYFGFSAHLTAIGDLVYLSFITAIPMHTYLGSSITNDTLAMLGATIFILGIKRLLEKVYTLNTYFILSLGIFLSYFSKLTAALLIFFALVYFFVYIFRKKQWISIGKFDIALIIIFLLPIIYYQLSIIYTYHGLVPTFNLTHPKAYLTSGFYTAEEYRLHLSPTQWFHRMVHYIEGGWFGIHSHHSFTKNNWQEFLGLLVLHIIAIVAFFSPCNPDKNTLCRLGKMLLFAMFSVLIVQYIFSYNAHLKSGYLGGLQPRYLLPFMFGFAIMASLFVERFKQYFLFNIVIILICIHAIYSDFFYFLQYYH